MTDYAIQELLFNDGEGIDLADLNGMQRFIRSQLWDQVVGAAVRDTEYDQNGPGSTRLHAIGVPSPTTSGTVRTVSNLGGVLMHRPVSFAPVGSDARMLAYRVGQFDLDTQLDIGDANPRIDLISVKLEQIENDAADQESRSFKNYSSGLISTVAMVKRRKVKLTKTVTKGTPAATPTIPATPAGYVPWCSVYVPASHNAVIDVENIRDHLYPAALHPQMQPVVGLGGGAWAASGWSALSSGPGVQSTSAGTLYVLANGPNKHAGRLLRVGIMGLLTGCTVQLVRVNADNTTSFGGETVLADISSSFTGGANQLYTADESHANWSRPLWMNGFTAGVASVFNPKAAPNDARMAMMALKIAAPSSGKVVKFVTWDVARSP